jgi:hypothetical protein
MSTISRLPITKARINLGQIARRAHNGNEYFILQLQHHSCILDGQADVAVGLGQAADGFRLVDLGFEHHAKERARSWPGAGTLRPALLMV